MTVCEYDIPGKINRLGVGALSSDPVELDVKVGENVSDCVAETAWVIDKVTGCEGEVAWLFEDDEDEENVWLHD